MARRHVGFPANHWDFLKAGRFFLSAVLIGFFLEKKHFVLGPSWASTCEQVLATFSRRNTAVGQLSL
jgi:hypothetical protein